MDESIFVSVIVPIYKVEKYLHRCIDSIIKQSYKNTEVILVDDGSPDNCPQICDEYGRKYKNVVSLHKSNGGLSEARNYGVERANGTHVTFVDSDDFIASDYIQELVSLIVNYNAEMSVVNIEKVYKEKERINNSRTVPRRICISGRAALERVLYQNGMDTSACGLLVPISVIRSNPFPVGKYHEDERTTYNYYLSCRLVGVSNLKLYYYFQRDASIMHTTFGKASMDELDAADILVNEIKKKSPDLAIAAEAKRFSDYCQVLLYNPKLEWIDKKNYLRIVNQIKSVRWLMLFNHKTRLKNKLAALLLIFGPKCILFFDRFLKRKKELKQ